MNKEILMVVDSVSNEKGISKDIIFRALERALEIVTAKRYGGESQINVRVAIDKNTGKHETFRYWRVVADDVGDFDSNLEIPLSHAVELNGDLNVGDVIEEVIESVDFGRIAAQVAKQVLMREIRNAEKEDLVKHYRGLIDSLLTGVVKKVNYDSVILDVGDGIEAVMYREHMLPREMFHLHDRVRGVLVEIREDSRGATLILSRTVPQMLTALFKLEVAEVGEDIITIQRVARDPGLRAKIAVKTNDGRIDPIGACIGIRGNRVQNVSNELDGERIDVILWDDDPIQLVVNAMVPAELLSIVVDENKHTMTLTVSDNQLALAIGRNGQNVRLASELTGWNLNVVSETIAKEQVQQEVKTLGKIFVDKLMVDQDLANSLVKEGFRTLEDVAYSPLKDLMNIKGLDKETVEILKERAKNILLEMVLMDEDNLGSVEPSKELLEFPGITRHLAYLLASRGIVSLEDLADQSVDDLSDIKELTAEDAGSLIMSVRKQIWN